MNDSLLHRRRPPTPRRRKPSPSFTPSNALRTAVPVMARKSDAFGGNGYYSCPLVNRGQRSRGEHVFLQNYDGRCLRHAGRWRDRRPKHGGGHCAVRRPPNDIVRKTCSSLHAQVRDPRCCLSNRQERFSTLSSHSITLPRTT